MPIGDYLKVMGEQINKLKSNLEIKNVPVDDCSTFNHLIPKVLEIRDYDTGYGDGLDDGYNNGYGEGWNKGHENGYYHGKSEGYSEGYSKGRDEAWTSGYEQGRAFGRTEGIEQEHSDFWDIFQENGTRTIYEGAFSRQYWNDRNFKPKYDLNVGSGSTMFNQFGGPAISTEGVSYNLTKLLDDCKVKLNTSKNTTFANFFYYSSISRVPEINVTGATSALSGTFALARKLETIDKLVLKSDGSNTFNNTFQGCLSLREILIEGVIGSNISFADSSNLSMQSIDSIVTALKDFGGTTTTQTLTLHSEIKDYLEIAHPSMIATITQKGWTLA